MPASGLVRVFHASELDAATLMKAALDLGEDGVLWVAGERSIASLHNSAGTRARQVRALVDIEVDAGVLEYERSHDDLHVFCILSGDPFEVVEVQAWP